MSDTKPSRLVTREFKIALLVRLDRGERLAAGVRRKLLYERLNRKRGPMRGEAAVGTRSTGQRRGTGASQPNLTENETHAPVPGMTVSR